MKHHNLIKSFLILIFSSYTLNSNANEVKKIKISPEQATIMALENNTSLKIENYNPKILKTYELQEEAIYDPKITSSLNTTSDNAKRLLGSSTDILDVLTNTYSYSASIGKSFPTGTSLSFNLSNDDNYRYLSNKATNIQTTNIGLTFTQSLLQGRDYNSNIAIIEQKKIDTLSSEYSLRAFIENLVNETEKAYWNYFLAEKELNIYKESLKIAKINLEQINEKISVGLNPEIDIFQAKAEVALRTENIVQAENNLQTSKLKLLRILNINDDWSNFNIETINNIIIPEIKLDNIEEHKKLSLKLRPEINLTKLLINKNELEVIKTRDGLLPKVDLILNLAKVGYATDFFNSIAGLGQNTYNIQGNIKFNYPIENKEAEAKYRRSEIQKEQNKISLNNLSQLVELDIRTAYYQLKNYKNIIKSSKASVELNSQKLKAEEEKYKVGKSIYFNVIQAQRDLLQSLLSENKVIIEYIKLITEFYRLEGTLLIRKQIKAPGIEEIKLFN